MSAASTLPFAVSITAALAALLVALVLSAVESALARLSRASVQDMVDEDKKNATLLAGLLAHRSRTELALRGLRTLSQTILVMAITLVFVRTSLPLWAIALLSLLIAAVSQFVAVSLIATRWGGRRPEKVALWAAPWTSSLVKISHVFDPFIVALRGWFPAPSRTEAEARAEMAEDLREMVDQVGETELLEAEDRQMLRSVFELGRTLVREVMVPRTEMVTADADLPARKALRLFVRSGFSRIPVVGDDVDDVRGVLYFKDVVQRMEAAEGQLSLVAEQMMRPAEFTVETKPADDLLRHMQAEHYHLALVVDEYGGISGLVTLEDLIEEVVGELTDEHDRNVVEPEELPDGSWRVPARFSVWEVGELLGIEIDDEDVDSVGGLLAKAIGKVPLPGAEGDLAGLHMMAEEARGRRRQVGTIVCSLSASHVEPSPIQED
ncbi:hemolysin family protein [Schaalia suimastitidis]|uniref:hemolysin family protein n=1 Tax=Schaalia suimastitidis TaxID=121163 RepID=UPI000406DE88|nr:hemolysin family protein [Schaalia suimastitidis]